MKNKSRSNKSFCEKSMKMVTNVIKISSLSIARMSLGRTASQPASGKTPGPAAFIKGSQTTQVFESLRSQEPMNIKKPKAYLIEAVESDKSMHVMHQENSVDKRASDFIRRVHEKNRRDSKEALSYSAFIIPPPPRFI